MQPPSVLIAANPYEAELCRRALVETGLRVVVTDGGEGALEQLTSERPLVLVIALGLVGVEPLELLQQARARLPKLPIYLLGDRDSALQTDEATQLGATRLFLRPIDADALADAIERVAVEAEQTGEVSDALAEFSLRPPTIDAEPLVEESIVELEADYEGDAPGRPLARIALRRVPREGTDVINAVERTRARTAASEGVARADDSGPIAVTQAPAEVKPFEVTLPPDQPPQRAVTEVVRRRPDEKRRADEPLDAPPPSVAMPESPRLFASEERRSEALLRADDALADGAVGLQALALAPDFVGELQQKEARDEARAPFDERSTVALRLERELSAAERRLFPDSPSTPSRETARSEADDPYADALGDIDLDRIGFDTIPGLGDALDLPRRNGHGAREAERPSDGLRNDARPAADAAADARHDFDVRPPTLPRAPLAPLPEDEGDLAQHDIATLLSELHRAGFSGRLDLVRGDGEKALFFDGGLPVFAASSLAHDRLVELLFREGKVAREQLARARALPDGGRTAAQQLVELGLIKSSELFATLRHHVEEILYSVFAWHTGRYRLTRELALPEDRVRLGASPWALVVEGVRRKYGLERLVELVGPPETVLAPTANLLRALDECGLSPPERARAEAIDGERSLSELGLVTGAPLGETALYALAWGLVAVGAARVGVEEKGAAASGLPTLVSAPASDLDRRMRPRPESRARDREADRAVDKERLLAKRAQIEDGDYYAVLGLSRDATPHEIGRACERLKREFAPERFAESVRLELGEALAEIADVLDEAQRVLGDERMRNAYRSHLPSA